MKISELIAQLEIAQKEFGDLHVLIYKVSYVQDGFQNDEYHSFEEIVLSEHSGVKFVSLGEI